MVALPSSPHKIHIAMWWQSLTEKTCCSFCACCCPLRQLNKHLNAIKTGFGAWTRFCFRLIETLPEYLVSLWVISLLCPNLLQSSLWYWNSNNWKLTFMKCRKFWMETYSTLASCFYTPRAIDTTVWKIQSDVSKVYIGKFLILTYFNGFRTFL
jgi:hypothetical protein